MQHTNAFLKLVEEAKKAIRETDADTIASRMEAGEEFVLVDVREDREWANGHIQGAIHLGVVFALFITLPYGKFAHGVYRGAALLKWAIEKRRPSNLALGGD